MRKILGITMGDPAGVGPEITVKALQDPKVYESYLKLRRETWYFSTSEHEKRKKDKSFSKLVDEAKKRKAHF